jgi:hypothetical protein
MLAVPRPVDPTELPDPAVSPQALEQAARAEDALAARAEAEAARDERLDFDVRTLGSAIRAYGLADVEGDDRTVTAARQRVADAAKLARAHGDEPLRKLRAYQLRAFLRALRAWEATGAEPAELRELGGPFVTMAGRNGWVSGGRLRLDDAVRRAMFKKRWNDLALTYGPGFDLALDEQRALYRFLLRYPPRTDPGDAGPRPFYKRDAGDRAVIAAYQYQLHKVEELAAIDPAYPADLARGVVLYRLRHYGAARELFSRWLDAHPDGPYTLRAQNYLRAALGHATDDEI